MGPGVIVYTITQVDPLPYLNLGTEGYPGICATYFPTGCDDEYVAWDLGSNTPGSVGYSGGTALCLALLREAARINGIIPAMAAALGDGRRVSHVEHSTEELLTQRIVQICHGYEDANDCDRLRHDAAIKAAAERGPFGPALASQPTMSRFDQLWYWSRITTRLRKALCSCALRNTWLPRRGASVRYSDSRNSSTPSSRYSPNGS